MGILATSIIAKCAFGMTVDNLGRKDDPFIENANALANPPQINSPKLLLFCEYIHQVLYQSQLITLNF